jgi:hypothetical protein
MQTARVLNDPAAAAVFAGHEKAGCRVAWRGRFAITHGILLQRLFGGKLRSKTLACLSEHAPPVTEVHVANLATGAYEFERG